MIGVTRVPVTVTNNSAKRSDYMVEVAADAPDGSRVGTAIPVTVSQLEPGQTTTAEAMFSEDMPEGVTFKVLRVSRTASL